jgi:hypothetical protein
MDDETVTTRPSRLPFVFGATALVYTFFAVTSIVGAGTSVGVGLTATVVATGLYVLSAIVWLVSSVRRTRRGGALDQTSMRFVGLAPPAGGALLLAAAYVARMNGQPFLGGFEAMVITTVALVVLSRAFPLLGFGPSTPGQRQSSGGGGASS